MRILYCLSKDVMRKVTLNTPNETITMPFMIPQIGASMVMQDQTFIIGKVKHDFDKNEVSVYSNKYIEMVQEEVAKRKVS
jgi:hypothetical protein